MDALLVNLQSPIILFFILGIFAGLVKSDLEIPGVMAKGFALYLIAAIGLKGGIAIAQEAFGQSLYPLYPLQCLFSAALPFLGSFLLKYTTSWGQLTALPLQGITGQLALLLSSQPENS